MRKIARLASVMLVASLLGCTDTSTPTIITGKMNKTTATNPKLAVVTVEGATDAEATKALEAKVSQKTDDNKIPMTSVVKPKEDGTYTLSIAGSKNIVVASVYGWDDLDNNDRVNGSEPGAKTSTGAQFYLFRKTSVSTREIQANGDSVSMANSYDWAF